eukprot:1160387-Pelagomonas_calceolata.AAC.10
MSGQEAPQHTPALQGKPAQEGPACAATQTARAAWAAAAAAAAARKRAAKRAVRKLPTAAGEHEEGSMERVAVMKNRGSRRGARRNKHGAELKESSRKNYEGRGNPPYHQ